MPATRWTLLSLGLGVALAGSVPGKVARAQAPAPEAPPDFEAAKRHYQAGETASTAGDHAVAAREYKVAYDITKDAVLFFKIGQAHERAGDCRSALSYYGRFLKETNPSPDHRQRTEARVAECEKRVAAAKTKPGAAAPAPDATTSPTPRRAAGAGAAGTAAGAGTAGTAASAGTAGTAASAGTAGTAAGAGTAGTAAGTGTEPRPPVEPKPEARPTAPSLPPTPAPAAGGPTLDRDEAGWQKTAAWTSVGITVALGTSAAVLGLSAVSREEDIENLIDFRDTEGMPSRYTGATRDRYRDLVREGKRLETLSFVTLAATGAAAAASVVFFLLDGSRTRGEGAARSSLAPAVGPGAAGLLWSGRF